MRDKLAGNLLIWAFPIALVLCSKNGTAETMTYTVVGEGNVSCGEWIDERRSARVTPQAAWVLGYISAASRLRLSGGNFTSGISGTDVDRWMDKLLFDESV